MDANDDVTVHAVTCFDVVGVTREDFVVSSADELIAEFNHVISDAEAENVMNGGTVVKRYNGSIIVAGQSEVNVYKHFIDAITDAKFS